MSSSPQNDWSGFFKSLEEESARGAVILACAFLDAQLRNLLASFLIDEPSEVEDLIGGLDTGEKPLSSFSSRIRAAYCLGLLSPMMYHDLNIIRKIRNKFAHRMHDYTFDDPQVVSWCNSLKLSQQITEASTHFPNTHGNMFLLSTTELAMWIAMEELKVKTKQLQRKAPKDPTIQHLEVKYNKEI